MSNQSDPHTDTHSDTGKTAKTYSIEVLELGPMENFIYLIKDTATSRTAVVDPAWDTQAIIKAAKKNGMIITDILLTHSHHDHINGISDILNHYDAQLHLTHAEEKFWGDSQTSPTLHHGGDTISLGSTDITVLHTPGHTPGSACYLFDNQLITGDTMFVYGCGRCDLAGGDPEQMYDTLRALKNDLPGNTHTLPGHNYSVKSHCTLDQQIAGNPFYHIKAQEKFVHFRMHSHDQYRHSPYQAIMTSEMDIFKE